MVPSTIYLFVCPDENGFHGADHVAYLMLPNYTLQRRLDQDKDGMMKYTWILGEMDGNFVLIDDPSPGMVAGVSACLLKFDEEMRVKKIEHQCVHCSLKMRKRGHA